MKRQQFTKPNVKNKYWAPLQNRRFDGRVCRSCPTYDKFPSKATKIVFVLFCFSNICSFYLKDHNVVLPNYKLPFDPSTFVHEECWLYFIKCTESQGKDTKLLFILLENARICFSIPEITQRHLQSLSIIINALGWF